MSDPHPDWTQIVAERKVREGIDAGEFDNIPGSGEPVDLSIDPFTPAPMRLANKLLRNAGALPEWIQLEKEIQRERAALMPLRDKGINAIKFARNAASRERMIQKLRTEHHDRLDAVNTMILKYCFIVPSAAQQPFPNYNIKREMAALEQAIADATAVAAAEPPAPPKARRKLW